MLIRLARRFVPGNTIHSAIEAARKLNRLEMAATIDILLGRPKNRLEATYNTKEYIELLDAIRCSKVGANVSIKLTTLGLHLDEKLCEKNAATIAKTAGKIVLIIDMEEHAYHEATMRLFLRLHKKHKNVWITLQAYLHNSVHDAATLIKQRASVRLVKGVYNEKVNVVYKIRRHIDDKFMEIEAMLLKSGLTYAIATHDEKIIEFIKYTTRKKHGPKGKNALPSGNFEFQLLYGVKPWLAEELALEGFKVRIYVPYGRKWLSYVLRRMRESRH